MGNQQGKQGLKRAQTQYPFDDTEKKSRTDWTAGNAIVAGELRQIFFALFEHKLYHIWF